jgi:zona occludens toxin (predicted ATPase)
MSGDNRDTQRHRTLKGGRIVVNGGFSTFDCTIRNLSETGAKLEVTSSLPIPQRFELALHDGRRFACEVAWRTETEIGVKFA